MLRLPIFYVAFLAAILAACGLSPRRVALDSPEVAPFLDAVASSPRLGLGFTPIEASDDVRLERASSRYDAMLHVYGRTSRTIAFRKVGAASFRWIGEQESYTGPRTYSTPDGLLSERIVVTYETEPISGFPLRQLVITYSGPNEALSSAQFHSVAEVETVLQSWRTP